MYSQSEYRRMAEKNARVQEQLALARMGAEARRIQAENSKKVSLANNTTLPGPNAPSNLAVPRSVVSTTGHTLEGITNVANKSKIPVYNDPIDGSSSKRKANGHADAPQPKKANTNTFVPRAPGERYQGTAATQPPNSPILKAKPVTQQKAQHNGAMDVDVPSASGKTKMVQQQRPKDASAMDLDIPSCLGRKRGAENEIINNTVKKQRPNALLSSNTTLKQNSKVGKAVPKTHIYISTKPAPKTNYFNSLYPKNSKLKASAGRAIVTTEILRIPVPSTAVQAPSVGHTAPSNATSVVGTSKPLASLKAPKKDEKCSVTKITTFIKTSRNEKSEKLPAPAATPQGDNSPEETTAGGKGISRKKLQTLVANESGSAEQTANVAPIIKSDGKVTDDGLEKPSVKVSSQTPPVSPQGYNASTEGNEKSLKRKKDAAFDVGTERKKQRKGDGSATHGKDHAWGDAKPSLEEPQKPVSPPKDNARKNETLKSQNLASKVQNLVGDSNNGATRQNPGEKSPPADSSDHTPSANQIPVAEGKTNPSEGNSNTESLKDAKPSVIRQDGPNANNRESAARRAKPLGLYNGENACYINSVLQAIANIPMMAEHYRGLADKVVPEVADYVALIAENRKGGFVGIENDSKAKKKLKDLLERNKSKIRLGAYLGVLLNEMLDADPSADTPSSYVFRQACGVILANDRKERYDGEDQRGCMEYLEMLLDHLHKEESGGQTESFEAPSLIRDLFGLEAVTKLECQSCGHAWDSAHPEKKFAFTTGIPCREGSVCITECLDTYSSPDRVEVHCTSCRKTSEALKWMQLEHLSPYVLVNINRVLFHPSENRKEAIFTRNPTTISLPPSEVVTMKDGAEDVRYEAIGKIKHRGRDFTSGHWTAWMKVDGQWWHFDDDEVDDKEFRGTPRVPGARSVISMVVLKRSA